MNYDTLKKIFFRFDPETAHKIAEFGLRALYATPGGLEALAKFGVYKDEILTQNIWNLSFDNPVGIAGGFDKNATMIAPLAALGFGHIDFGTFTPRPQSGNEKPRLFRLVSEQSIQNAMGFNNEGADVIEHRVRKIYPFKIPIAANIGKNKATSNEDALSDYEALGRKFNGLCDFFIINVSSPNTPNLRALQENSFISELIGAMKKITNRPLVLKLAPDMSADQAIALCECAVQSGASGIIINNTSVDYSLSPNARDFGGLSGRLITEKSRKLFAQVARELFGRTVLISCGGIDSAQEAYERIKSGASLVQIFTAFIFKGPFVAKSINEGLAELLRADGFNNISEAVGVNLKDRAGEGYGIRNDLAENLGNGANLRTCEDKEADAKTDKISSATEGKETDEISNVAKGEETSEISNAPESRDADENSNDGKSEISSVQVNEILAAKTDEISSIQADKIPSVKISSSSEADENFSASANLNALINTDTATDQSSAEQSRAESGNSEIESAKRSSAKSENLEAKNTKQGSADQKQDKILKTTSKSGTGSKRGKISKDATQKDAAQKDTAKDNDASQKDTVQNTAQQKDAAAKNLSQSGAKSEKLETKDIKQSVAASKTAKTKTATKAASKNDIESKNSKTKAAPKGSAESKSLKAKNAKQSSAKTKNAEAKEAKEASGAQDAEQNSSKKRKAKKD